MRRSGTAFEFYWVSDVEFNNSNLFQVYLCPSNTILTDLSVVSQKHPIISSSLHTVLKFLKISFTVDYFNDLKVCLALLQHRSIHWGKTPLSKYQLWGRFNEKKKEIEKGALDDSYFGISNMKFDYYLSKHHYIWSHLLNASIEILKSQNRSTYICRLGHIDC